MNDLPTTNITVDPNNPWDNSLGREDFGKFFCDYLGTSPSPSIIELSAGYGEGKTTFLKRCEYELNRWNNIYPIYLNIWETDYYKDPLLCLLRAFNKSKVFKDIFENIGKSCLNALPSVLSGGTVTLSLGDMIFKDDDNTPEKSIEKIKNTIAGKAKEQGRIIVFVDELDRCRPDYAIQTLEVIKHIFSIENVIFVIATDGNRLKACVESVYGTQSSHEDYLRKFVDVHFHLPETKDTECHKTEYDEFGYQILLHPSLREANAIRYSWEKLIGDKKRFNPKNWSLKVRNIDLCDNNIVFTTLMFMFMLRHMKPDIYFKIGNMGIYDLELPKQLKRLSVYDKDVDFIKGSDDFKNYLRAICTPKSEMKKIIQDEVFDKSQYYKSFLYNKIMELDSLKKYDYSHTNSGMFYQSDTWEVSGTKPENSDEAKKMYQNIQKHALTLWLHHHIGQLQLNKGALESEKTLAQVCYDRIEEGLNRSH